MPNKIHGITDASQATLGLGVASKTVCVVGTKDSGITTDANKLFDIMSVADAETKFGPASKAVSLVSILFKNGVSSIVGIIAETPTAPATKATTYDTAMAELLRYPSVGVVILDEIDPTVTKKLGDNLDLAESQDIFRYGVVGSDTDDNSSLASVASALNHKRIFVPGPVFLDTTGTKLGGIYGAAGLASLIATETADPALPMNGVTIEGFGGLNRVLLDSEKDALSSAGITALYIDGNKPAVYRLVTTYTKNSDNEADVTWQEGTTVLISDDVLSSCQQMLKSRYKRTKNVARILKAIRTDIIAVLQTKNDLEIIENFDANTVTVIKDPNDMYGALIDYEYDVVTPLYTITIRQHLKL